TVMIHVLMPHEKVAILQQLVALRVFFLQMIDPPAVATLFPYTTLFRSFCKPIALSMPLAVSAPRGGEIPSRGSGVTVLQTTAPSERRSTNRDISFPEPKQPDAVTIGFARRAPPSVIARSTPMRSPHHRTPDRPCTTADASGFRSRARAGCRSSTRRRRTP